MHVSNKRGNNLVEMACAGKGFSILDALELAIYMDCQINGESNSMRIMGQEQWVACRRAIINVYRSIEIDD